MQKTTKPKTKHAFTPNPNERKWWQPQFQLHFGTKSHGRPELGLLTLSAVVNLWKMMLCTMFWCMQILCEQQIYWMFPLFRARVDLKKNYFHLLTLASCVILALQVCVLILGYAVYIFCITDTKCVIFGVCWHRSLKGSATPDSKASTEYVVVYRIS